MNEPDITKSPETQELDETQVEEVAGGGDNCAPEQYLAATGSLIQAYENVVDFTSHVIERVVGPTNN
jgi:hypothetical protein